jgi:hypothetical protein
VHSHAGQADALQAVPSKLDQIAFGFSIKKSGANHFSIRICAALPRKGIFGYSQSQGIKYFSIA